MDPEHFHSAAWGADHRDYVCATFTHVVIEAGRTIFRRTLEETAALKSPSCESWVCRSLCSPMDLMPGSPADMLGVSPTARSAMSLTR